MGEKDIAEKILLAHNDVFSDIVNVLLFGGQEVIQENDLEDQTMGSAYKADGKLHEIDRDVAKRWKSGNQQLRHVKEVLQLFSIMTDDNRFEEIYNEELKKKEELRQCVMYWIVQ